MTKKRNLLLVSLFLVFGLATMASTAFAQAGFSIKSNQNNSVRGEGLAEAVGSITLTTTDTGVITTYSKFVITYPLPITDIGTVNITCSGVLASSLCAILPVSTLLPTYLSGGNTILTIPFIGNAHLTGNTDPGTSFTVTVRVNATAGKGVLLLNATVSTHNAAGALPGEAVTINQGSSTGVVYYWIGTLQAEPALSVGFGYYYKWVSEEADVIICLGVLKGNDEFQNHFVINVDENFVYALTSESYEFVLDPGEPGAGELTNGSNISVTLWNIPKGFGIKAETPIPCSNLTGTPLYCATGTLAVSTTGTTWFEGDGVTTSVTFEFPVTSTDNDILESVDIPFKFWTEGPVGIEGLPPIGLTVQKDPNPIDDPACFIPTPACWPRFAYEYEGTVVPLDVVEFENCITNLLWPFITVNGAWDSAIAVSNTTMDQLWDNPNPFLAAGSALPETGSCDLSFYSNGTLILEWGSSTPIAAGSTMGWDMSPIVEAALPGFANNGYVFGTCNFSNAKGYAYIVNSYGTSNAMFGNYLAEIIPDPEWIHRSLNGWGLGEGAITPLNINREYLQLLLLGFDKHHHH